MITSSLNFLPSTLTGMYRLGGALSLRKLFLYSLLLSSDESIDLDLLTCNLPIPSLCIWASALMAISCFCLGLVPVASCSWLNKALVEVTGWQSRMLGSVVAFSSSSCPILVSSSHLSPSMMLVRCTTAADNTPCSCFSPGRHFHMSLEMSVLLLLLLLSSSALLGVRLMMDWCRGGSSWPSGGARSLKEGVD